MKTPTTTQGQADTAAATRRRACGVRVDAAFRGSVSIWRADPASAFLGCPAAIATAPAHMYVGNANPVGNEDTTATKRPARHLGTRST